MDNDEIDKLKKVRFYTDRSIGDCREALTKSNGDVFAAIKLLLTVEQINSLGNYAITRKLCPANLMGPPTKELSDLLDYLRGRDSRAESEAKNALLLRKERDTQKRDVLKKQLESFAFSNQRVWLEENADLDGRIIFETCSVVPHGDGKYTVLELAEVISFYFGLMSSPTASIDGTYARRIGREVLHRDLAFHDVRLSLELLAPLVDEFFQMFGDEANFFTNGSFADEPFHLQGWSPCTESTFDTGVLAIAGSSAGIIWAADDD
ncbi:MAG: hypothetical protein K2W95_34270 [Candidatus Obscuribacterales bacterium]|nr:hypothetical protein [Candidatus Obscuribacterales bacterium]